MSNRAYHDAQYAALPRSAATAVRSICALIACCRLASARARHIAHRDRPGCSCGSALVVFRSGPVRTCCRLRHHRPIDLAIARRVGDVAACKPSGAVQLAQCLSCVAQRDDPRHVSDFFEAQLAAVVISAKTFCQSVRDIAGIVGQTDILAHFENPAVDVDGRGASSTTQGQRCAAP